MNHKSSSRLSGPIEPTPAGRWFKRGARGCGLGAGLSTWQRMTLSGAPGCDTARHRPSGDTAMDHPLYRSAGAASLPGSHPLRGGLPTLPSRDGHAAPPAGGLREGLGRTHAETVEGGASAPAASSMPAPSPATRRTAAVLSQARQRATACCPWNTHAVSHVFGCSASTAHGVPQGAYLMQVHAP